MDLHVRFRVTVHRLFGLPAASGPFVLRHRRGPKRRGEAPAQKSDAKGQVLLDHSFEVDGTLQCRGGNKYRPKWLELAVEEVRPGHRRSFGTARLDLAQCLPLGHTSVRQLAFGACSGDVVVRGTLASGAVQPPDDMPLASTLLRQLHDAQLQLHEQDALLDALRADKVLTPADLSPWDEPHRRGAAGQPKPLRPGARRPERPADAAAARVEQLEAALLGRTQECHALRACVRMLEEKISDDAGPPPRQLQAELAGTARRCSGLEQALGAVRQKCSGLADVLEVQQYTIAALERQLAAAARHIHTLEARVRRSEAAPGERPLPLPQVEPLLAQLRQEAEAKEVAEKQLEAAAAALAAQEGRVSQLQAEVDTLRRLLEDAGQATQEVIDLQAQLQASDSVRQGLAAAAAAAAAQCVDTAATAGALQARALRAERAASAASHDAPAREADPLHSPQSPPSPDSRYPRGRASLGTLWGQLQAKDEEIRRLQQENARLAASFSPDRRLSSRVSSFRFENVSTDPPTPPPLSPRADLSPRCSL